MVYGKRSNGNAHGLVLTKQTVVDAMLSLVDYVPENDLSHIRVIEPAAGDGAFATRIVSALHASSVYHKFDFVHSLRNLYFYELDESMADQLEERLANLMAQLGFKGTVLNVHRGDYLLADQVEADIVIGNPPYVRYDNIPDRLKAIYRSIFETFSHRCDIYVPFFEKALESLTDGGKLAFICSNRWFKSQYGSRLRDLIAREYTLEWIFDMEQICPFEEEVIAYPAVTLISNSGNHDVAKYCRIDNESLIPRMGELEGSSTKLQILVGQDWFRSVQSSNRDSVELLKIEEQGFKIGIGVATGSDRVFISKSLFEIVEPSRALPLVMSRDLRNDNFDWGGDYLLNPYEDNGELIDLGKYPLTKCYLESHSETLMKRHVSKKNPNSWYRTIDKVKVELLNQPKVLLPDISGNTRIFIDKGQYYPHHNVYYITGKKVEHLKLIAAILMSKFISEQLKNVSNIMNGGYPRWQSQNLRKLLLPNISAMDSTTQKELLESYESNDIEGINNIIDSMLDNKAEVIFHQN